MPRAVRVFCAVLAWSRVRFVRFAADERWDDLAMLAEYFETLGGVPGKVLADRMGCLEGGVIANVVVPTPEYVRSRPFGFRPDFWRPPTRNRKESSETSSAMPRAT